MNVRMVLLLEAGVASQQRYALADRSWRERKINNGGAALLIDAFLAGRDGTAPLHYIVAAAGAL
jgi:hypothetical protein